jgi:hypothetical protein
MGVAAFPPAGGRDISSTFLGWHGVSLASPPQHDDRNDRTQEHSPQTRPACPRCSRSLGRRQFEEHRRPDRICARSSLRRRTGARRVPTVTETGPASRPVKDSAVPVRPSPPIRVVRRPGGVSEAGPLRRARTAAHRAQAPGPQPLGAGEGSVRGTKAHLLAARTIRLERGRPVNSQIGP